MTSDAQTVDQIVYHLGCYGIKVTLDSNGGAVIESTLRAQAEAEWPDELPALDAAFHAIESLVLAHAVSGVDVLSPEYRDGIEVAVDSILNHLDF